MVDPPSFVLENARLVLPDRVAEGWLAVVGETIAEWGEGPAPERGLDLGGDFLLPGLVEIHTDHLESHYAPRAHVRWEPLSAVLAYDAQLAASGITTVFDSLRAGTDADNPALGEDLVTLAEALDDARGGGHLRIDHRTHLRCEIATPDVVEQAERFAARFPLHLVSLMDHTPGQRQFRDLATWRLFFTGRSGMAESEIQALIEHRLELHARFAAPHRASLAALAERVGAVLASHDDATAAHVAEAARDGVRIAEFPTTVEAAEASKRAGIAVVMGAPNIVRGGSHSGNIAAESLACEGLLDALSSDYVPASLLLAAFRLPQAVPAITLPDAVGMVTSAPARAAGLDDRGAIAAGLRADLVRVAPAGETPVVRRVWTAGRIAA